MRTVGNKEGKYSPESLVSENSRTKWIHSYFDNVMTKFMINNSTDE